MSDEDISLSEKRVYAEATDATTAYIGTGTGVIRVSVSDDLVGEFSLVRRGAVTDIATAEGRLAIGTPDDVFVRTENAFEGTDFGPASAVGYDPDGDLLAAGDGRIARYDTGWKDLGELAAVKAIEGRMAAADSGVHRLDGSHVGLESVNDVSTAGTPLAATESGLYYLANGWVCTQPGAFTLVESDGPRYHAATDTTLYKTNDPRNDWTPSVLPVEESVVGIAYTDHVYAITKSGTFLANAGDGWRHRSLGVPDVTGLVVV